MFPFIRNYLAKFSLHIYNKLTKKIVKSVLYFQGKKSSTLALVAMQRSESG